MANDVAEAMDIESTLSGSLLESGFPFGDQARTGQSVFATVAGGLGFDTSERRDAIAGRDRLQKLQGQILGIRMNRMIAGGESITNDKLAFLQSISPGTDKSPQANALLYADFLQEELNIADIEETPISASERKRSMDFIRKARSGEFFQSDNEPTADGSDPQGSASESFGRFADFTLEKLQDIDVAALSVEDLPAFRARFDQLKQIDIPDVSIPDVLRMNFEQLKQTDFGSMSESVKNAALERYQQLAEASAPVIESALEKAKAGLATAQDFAQMSVEEIQQIDEQDIKDWTQEQLDEYNRRRKQLGLAVKFAAFKFQRNRLKKKEE